MQHCYCYRIILISTLLASLALARQPRTGLFLRPWRPSLLGISRATDRHTTTMTTSMEGRLFVYHKEEFATRVAFQSGRHKKHVVLVGGLGDGLIPVPYTTQLAEALDAKGWSLVQVLMSSSYTGFGHCSLKSDCAELDSLLGYLEREEGSDAIGIVGHSTGCQDAVYFAKEGQNKSKLRFLALQAPVSDREHMAMVPTATDYVSMAREMQAGGKGSEMLPREAMWAPITADRFLDLSTKEGLDDMFSSDLTDEELESRLGHVDVPILFAFSGADEYVPGHVDVTRLAQRLVTVVKGRPSRSVVIEGANHSLRGHEEQFVMTLLDFIGVVRA